MKIFMISNVRIAVILFLSMTMFSQCTERTAENPPTLILTNGHIWTGIDATTFEEAIAITGNTITQVGNSETIEALAGKETQIIDLQGKLVTAGFNDAHIHFLSGSLGLTEVELSSTLTLEETIANTLNFISKNPTKEWITGRGWQYTFFESGLPDHTTMNAFDIDKPLFIKAYDGHSAYANKKALALAGITATTTFDGFGEVVKDITGIPTGVLKEEAMGLVSEIIPPPSFEDKLTALRKGLTMAASLGITSVQNANGTETDVQLFKQLLSEGSLTVRYAAAFSINDKTTDAQLDRFAFLKDSIGVNNPFLRADAVKFMIDGVIESHSAAMISPYADVAPNAKDAVGYFSMPVAKYKELVKLCHQKGFRIYTHAIGDLGVREALNAYELTLVENNPADRRHRVEHIETISPADLPRFKELGVMPSMEPIHAEPGTVSVWSNAIGEIRLPYSFAWRMMLDHDAHLVFSSDWPAATSVNPIRGLHVAVTRKNVLGLPEGGWVADQKLSIAEAMKAYTYSGAYSSFEENKKGLLKPGYLADVIVFSEDLFLIDPMKTHTSKIVLTIFDGKIIYGKL